MFQFSYVSLLSVTFMHDFYADKISRDFDFSPLPDTSLIMDSYGLRFKNMDGIFTLFQQHDKNNQPFQALDTIIDLYFKVSVKTDILNISEHYGRGKYLFSNLKTDGTYATQLTQTVSLSLADELPEISGQQKVLNFLPGTVNAVVLSKIVAGTGWAVVNQFPINAKASSLQLDVNNAGLYKIERDLVGGGKDQTIYLLSDELLKSGDSWSIIHLQLKPGDNNLAFSVTLTPKQSPWQYFLIEAKGRTGGAIVPGNLEVTYKADPPSRYPANMNMLFKDPSTYAVPVAQYVNAVLSDSKIKGVYLFESANMLELLDGEQPQVKIKYSSQEIAGKVTIPARSMNKTTIIYNL